MKLTKMVLALAASVILLGGQAMAEGVGANAGAVAGASAGATASGGTTKNYGLAQGGIGAALCADSVGTPILSVGISRRACEVMQGSMAMADRGLLTKAEARAFGLKALEMSGAVLAVKTAEPKALPNISGAWASLSRDHQKAVKECRALWNGKRVQGCTY